MYGSPPAVLPLAFSSRIPSGSPLHHDEKMSIDDRRTGVRNLVGVRCLPSCLLDPILSM